MDDEKEKWMQDVFQSMKGRQRSKPRPELFAKIKSQIDAPRARVISKNHWRLAAAAAVILLVLNIFALRRVAQENALNTDILVVENASSQQLISNYNIYE